MGWTGLSHPVARGGARRMARLDRSRLEATKGTGPVRPVAFQQVRVGEERRRSLCFLRCRSVVPLHIVWGSFGVSGALVGYAIRCSFASLGRGPPRIESTYQLCFEALLMAPEAILGPYGVSWSRLGALLGLFWGTPYDVLSPFLVVAPRGSKVHTNCASRLS